MAHQKLDYIHYNPVEAGFVAKPEEWKHSSAVDYYEGKGLLEIKIRHLNCMMLFSRHKTR